MKLSDELKRFHESGDFGLALEGLSEKAEELEDIAAAVAHHGVDLDYGTFYIDDSHIKKAREILSR